MSSLLANSKFQSRVSSILNKDIQQYGKSYMFDSNDETCWCSDQGTPQWVAVAFPSAVEVDCIQIQFQGGFVGKDCQIIVTKNDDMKDVTDIYPEDVNTLQTFKLNSGKQCKKLTVNFSTSTDFFGRIIIYKFDILGSTL